MESGILVRYSQFANVVGEHCAQQMAVYVSKIFHWEVMSEKPQQKTRLVSAQVISLLKY